MTSHLLALLALLVSGAQNDARLVHASRADKAGWIYLHLQGAPRDIGYQYGVLASAEIDDAHRALALNFKTTPYNWSWARKTAKDLFWTKLDQEYKDEIEGQAEGLKSKGYAYDAWDILAYNAYIELKDYYIPYLQSKTTGLRLGATRDSCSAFIATGSTTKDGKIVMGQNLWWDYVMGQRCNVLLDITPDKGNRLVMDAFCGFIHSGSDFAINSAGLVLCETTISGFFGFDPKGTPEFMRMRKAIQYANNLDDAVKIFKDGNNGGYANTWLIGDTKTNEIGKLELGLKNVEFVRKSDGFYVGSNFPTNPKLIAEEEPGGWDTNPKTNSCEDRRLRWNVLLNENKGAVDAERAKGFLADTYDQANDISGASGSTLCSRMDTQLFGAMNTKVVDAAMTSKMSLWAKMGFSNGSSFFAEDFFRSNTSFENLKPFLHDIPNQPWTSFPVNSSK
jgi:hypothetical protein